MLASAAVRVANGRAAPFAFRISSSSIYRRAYAYDVAHREEVNAHKTQSIFDEDSESAQDGSKESGGSKKLSKNSPCRINDIWGPNMRLGYQARKQLSGNKFASRVSQVKAPFSTLSQQRRYFASRPPGSSPPPNNAPDRRSEGQSNDTTSAFHSKLRDRSDAARLQDESSAEHTDEPQPTGPLPDLRHGIPSTFEPQTSDNTSSFKEKDAESSSLDLTADPTSSGGRTDDESPKEAYVSSIERRRNAIAYYMFLAAGVAAVSGVVYLGRNWDNESEAKAHPDAPDGYSPIAIYHRITERLGNLFGYYTEPAFEKLLPDPSPDPMLRAPYTLVLSLEDLLVSSKWDRANGYTVAKRPGVDYFLRYMSQYYELVIFTTVLPMNADSVLRKLDPFRFCIPLFRDATRYMDGEHVKDLSYLNRDLSKTLIIDTVPAHVKLQPENAIVLPKWKGDIKDPNGRDLVALIPFLEYIASMSIEDVRKVLKSYEGTHIPTEFHRRETKAREQFNKRLEEERSKRPKLGGGLGGLSSALGFKPNQGMMVVPGEQTPFEGFAEGKMLSDQMRERGQKQYLEMEKQLRENGESWLKQQEEEEKKMQEETARNFTGYLPFFGRPPGPEGDGK